MTEAITAAKFQNLFINGYDISDYIIQGDVTVTKLIFDSPIILSNCVFKNPVSISESVFNESLILQNCIFEAQFTIYDNSFIKTTSLVNSTVCENLTITNCSFEKLLFEKGQFGLIEFLGIIKEIPNSKNSVLFKGGTYKEIRFSCKEFNCPVKIMGGQYETITFEKNNLNNILDIGDLESNLGVKNLYAQSSDFNDRICFSQCHISDTTYLNSVNFWGQLIIDKTFKTNYFSFSSVIAKQNVSLNYDGNIRYLDINNCDFQSSFRCYHYSENLRNEGELTLNINDINRGNIIVENVPVPWVTLGGVNFANIIFRKTQTHFITISEFANQNKLTFTDLKLANNYNVLIIFDSNLGVTEFVNVDFRKFHEFVIAKSEVSNLLLSNSILPAKIQIGTNHPKLGYVIDTDDKINDNTYFRESYRQLKLAMEKQGNKTYALIFKAKEMHHLRKELHWGWDKGLLYLNYISNNHGLSWSRGLIFTIGISWILFIFYELTLINPDFYWTLNSTQDETLQAFGLALNSFSHFIASFPLFKNVEGLLITWQTYIILVLARIFIGYGIYQTITAFRKFEGK